MSHISLLPYRTTQASSYRCSTEPSVNAAKASVSERLVGFTNSRGVADRLLYSAFEADGARVLGSGRSGSLGIDDASAHVASTFLITSAGSDAGDEGSLWQGAFEF